MIRCCDSPRPGLVEGKRVCETCGALLPDPEQAKRDRYMAGLGREVAQLKKQRAEDAQQIASAVVDAVAPFVNGRDVARTDQLEAAEARVKKLESRLGEIQQALEAASGALKDGAARENALRSQLEAAEARADAAEAMQPSEPQIERRYLTTAEKAKQVGVTPETIRRNAARYGGWQDGDGERPRYRFPVEPPTPGPAKPPTEPRRQPTRRRRRQPQGSLLPIKGDGPLLSRDDNEEGPGND